MGTLRLALLALSLVIATVYLLRQHGTRQGQAQTPGDMHHEIRGLQAGLTAPPRIGPDHRFRIIPPAGWTIIPRSSDMPYNVMFRSPNGPDLRILALPTELQDFKELMQNLDSKERELGIGTDIEIIRFRGHKAARRTATLHGLKVRMLDFVHQGTSHHLQFSAHPEVFDAYLPVLTAIMATYEPLDPASDP